MAEKADVDVLLRLRLQRDEAIRDAIWYKRKYEALLNSVEHFCVQYADRRAEALLAAKSAGIPIEREESDAA